MYSPIHRLIGTRILTHDIVWARIDLQIQQQRLYSCSPVLIKSRALCFFLLHFDDSLDAISEFTRQRIAGQMTSQQIRVLAEDDAGIPEGEPSPAWQGVHLGT